MPHLYHKLKFIVIGRMSFCFFHKEHIFRKLYTESCSPNPSPVQKGDKLSKNQCPQIEQEKSHAENTPESVVVDRLMYAQVCT